MIQITFYSDSGKCNGFSVEGHAGFAPAGQDIVCAAVSALAQGTVLAVCRLSGCEYSLQEERGYLDFRIRVPNYDYAAQILLAGLEVAAASLQEQYPDYVCICHG